MLLAFLWMWNTQDTTCWNLKTQSQRAHRGAQACLDLSHSCWRPNLHLSWTSSVLCSQLYPSASLLPRSCSPHLSLCHNLNWERSRLYWAPLQGLQGISDKDFQLAATSGKSTSMFWIQYIIASHPLPFRLLFQITTNQLHSFPEIHDSYRSDLAYFMITQLTPTFGLLHQFLLIRSDTEIASPLLAASHFWEELFLLHWSNVTASSTDLRESKVSVYRKVPPLRQAWYLP